MTTDELQRISFFSNKKKLLFYFFVKVNLDVSSVTVLGSQIEQANEIYW